MSGMIPRGARGPGARRGEEAHRASARAGARRARQGGRGAGRVPQVRRTHLVREGHDRDGSQRWARGSCGRTLSRKTMGLFGYFKPEGDVWASCAEHACAGGTPGECARACGVCPGTSWFMRMRLCEVMGRALAPFRSGPTVSCQVDGTYLDESLAGNRSRFEGGDAPRAAPLRRRRARARHIEPQGVRALRGQRPRRRVLRARGQGQADRRGARPRPCGPWARARPSRPTASRGTPGCCRGSACRATTRRPRARPGTASSAWRTRCTRGPRASWRASGGLDEEARPLPRLVPVGRADEEVGRRQGGHPVGPGGDRRLRPHARRPREGAAAVLVLLGGETGHVNGGLTESCPYARAIPHRILHGQRGGCTLSLVTALPQEATPMIPVRKPLAMPVVPAVVPPLSSFRNSLLDTASLIIRYALGREWGTSPRAAHLGYQTAS